MLSISGSAERNEDLHFGFISLNAEKLCKPSKTTSPLPLFWNIFHACSYIAYNFIKVGTRFSYCAPVFGQFLGILDTFLNTELIFLRIPRELVIIYLCKRTPYGITALVIISICSSRTVSFDRKKMLSESKA